MTPKKLTKSDRKYILIYILLLILSYAAGLCFGNSITPKITGFATVITSLLVIYTFLKVRKKLGTLVVLVVVGGASLMLIAYLAYLFLGVSPSAKNHVLLHIASSLTYDHATMLIMFSQLILLLKKDD